MLRHSLISISAVHQVAAGRHAAKLSRFLGLGATEVGQLDGHPVFVERSGDAVHVVALTKLDQSLTRFHSLVLRQRHDDPEESRIGEARSWKAEHGLLCHEPLSKLHI